MFIAILVEPARYISNSWFLHSWFQGRNFPEICQPTIVMTADTSRPNSYESQIPTEFDKHVILQYFLVYRGYTVCIEGQTAEYLTCFMLAINAMGKVSISNRECWEYIGTDSCHEPVVEPRKSVQSGVSGWWDFFIGWLHNSCDTFWNWSNSGCLDVPKFFLHGFEVKHSSKTKLW